MRVAQFGFPGIVLLLAAPTSRAEATAPLESTKQELRQLESTQKNRAGPMIPGEVKLDTPTLDVGRAGNPAAPQWLERRREDEERARRQKQKKEENWLVNGVERLSRQEESASAGTPDVPTDQLDALNGTPDREDPQYLLKLFDEQGKRSAAHDTAPKVRSTPAPDPFAPFLQDWLGNSPVRNQVLEQFRTSGEATAAMAAPGSAPDFRGSTLVAGANTVSSSYEPAPAIKPNPYLTESNASILTKNVLTGIAPLSTLERTVSAPIALPPAVVTPSPLPDARAPVKGPPSSPADDKKYFPQLNRF